MDRTRSALGAPAKPVLRGSSSRLSGYREAAGQRGVTLIVVLLILIGVTILGVGGAHIALQSERSTRYDRDYQVAWQSAEAALMDAEADIFSGTRQASFDKRMTGLFVPGCGTGAQNRGLCEPAASGKAVWYTVNFLDNGAEAPTVAFGTYTNRARFDVGSGVKPAREPRYIIEWVRDRSAGMGAGRDVLYRITAMGFGPREDVQVVLQSVFKKE